MENELINAQPTNTGLSLAKELYTDTISSTRSKPILTHQSLVFMGLFVCVHTYPTDLRFHQLIIALLPFSESEKTANTADGIRNWPIEVNLKHVGGVHLEQIGTYIRSSLELMDLHKGMLVDKILYSNPG